MIAIAGRLTMLAAVLMLVSAFGSTTDRLFAPSADPWPRWEAHDPGSRQVVDHSALSALLTKYVIDRPGANLVRYVAMKADRAALDGYLGRMAGVKVSGLSRPEQLAYWANLYNALTLKVVLDAWPVASIRDIDISPGLLASGPWDAKLIRVEGVELTLNDIEHRIIRPIWRDPRIHYIVNCASIGCPDLQTRAFAGSTIDAELDRLARDYVNDPRGVNVAAGSVTVSKIYDWFIEDFGGDEAGVIRHLSRYARPDIKAAIAKGLDQTAYDWSINAAR